MGFNHQKRFGKPLHCIPPVGLPVLLMVSRFMMPPSPYLVLVPGGMLPARPAASGMVMVLFRTAVADGLSRCANMDSNVALERRWGSEEGARAGAVIVCNNELRNLM